MRFGGSSPSLRASRKAALAGRSAPPASACGAGGQGGASFAAAPPELPLSPAARAKALAAAGFGRVDPISPRAQDERRKSLAGQALGEQEVVLSRLTALAEDQQEAVWARAQTLKEMRRAERSAAATPQGKHVNQLHAGRSLADTASATRSLLWMQQQLIGVRRLKRVVVERIESAWLLVGREGISAHLLDVLENRIKRVDQVAMQNLIDVEQSWLLGKAPPPKRTGGGFQREAGGKLMHEAAWYHNLEVRHLALSQGAKGGAVPPPLSPGLRTGSSVGQSTAALWPDSARPPPWRG